MKNWLSFTLVIAMFGAASALAQTPPGGERPQSDRDRSSYRSDRFDRFRNDSSSTNRSRTDSSSTYRPRTDTSSGDRAYRSDSSSSNGYRSDSSRNDRDRGYRSDSGGGSGSLNQDFAIIVERNIFLKNRRVRSESRPTTSTTQSTPEQRWVLVGTLLEEGGDVALLENSATGETLKAVPGQTIASGKVSSVGFEYMEFESGDRKIRVDVGRNLTGAVASSASAASAASTAESSPPTPIDPNDPNASILERLRQRRMQETQR